MKIIYHHVLAIAPLFLILGTISGIFIGMAIKETQPYNCPDSYCPRCEQENKQITKFQYPDNIRMLNEEYLFTTEEIIEDYSIVDYILSITNYNQTNVNRKICIEHKFDNVDIVGSSLILPLEGYGMQGIGYRLDCWELPVMGYMEKIKYNLRIEQGINQNQNVRITIW